MTSTFDFLSREKIGPQSFVLRGFALDVADQLLRDVEQVISTSPFRNLTTPGGLTMSVGMTNCGKYGWVSDRTGYRYDPIDPLINRPWPAMPNAFTSLATRAARDAGFVDCAAQACLINQYLPGTRLSLHQDRDEQDLTQPIVSVSLGLPATFMFGGHQRSDPTQKYALQHGDVVVWGGVDRLRFHGVAPIKDGEHSRTGRRRINLTFRRVTAMPR